MRATLWCRLSAPWQLARLAWATRFRLRGAYWSWRWQTAWGPEGGASGTKHRLSGGQRLRAMLEYGAWVASMRRL